MEMTPTTSAPTPTRDDWLQAAVTFKENLTQCYNELALVAVIFADSDDKGALASHLVTSTQNVTTLAAIYEVFGPDAIEATDPLDLSWWRAILKTDDPAHWLEQARTRQLSAAQIRNEAGVKQTRKPAWYDGSGTFEDGRVTLDSEPEDQSRRRVGVRLVAKE